MFLDEKYRMFGEDYFTDKNKYSYKAMTKKNILFK